MCPNLKRTNKPDSFQYIMYMWSLVQDLTFPGSCLPHPRMACVDWSTLRDPTFTKAIVDQSAQVIHTCCNQLPGTQWVKPSLLTEGVPPLLWRMNFPWFSKVIVYLFVRWFICAILVSMMRNIGNYVGFLPDNTLSGGIGSLDCRRNGSDLCVLF